jgi:hypothetical protein
MPRAPQRWATLDEVREPGGDWIGRYLNLYNVRRPYSSLDGMTPDQAYFTPLPLRTAA